MLKVLADTLSDYLLPRAQETDGPQLSSASPFGQPLRLVQAASKPSTRFGLWLARPQSESQVGCDWRSARADTCAQSANTRNWGAKR